MSHDLFERLLRAQLRTLAAGTALTLAACTGSGPKADTTTVSDTDTDTDTDADADTDTDTDADTDTDTDTDVDSAATGDTGTSYPRDPMCDGIGLPPYYIVSVGHVAIEPGGDCPAPEDVDHVDHQVCCPMTDYRDVMCGAAGRLDHMMQDPYYGYWSPAPTGATGPEVKDLCLYEGVFEEGGTCCGRPLLADDGSAVLATVRSAGPDAPLGPVAAYWLQAARMEHASVASFARFTLELVRLGAPAELLADAQRAGLDEVDHAQRCFALASRFAGRRFEPGPMDLASAAELSPDLLAFVDALVREGCVGETLASLDAAARLQAATDPEVREVLQVIVDDEGRHAALAWRTLSWLLSRDDSGELLAHAQSIFAEERVRAYGSRHPDVGDGRRLGLLDDATRDRVFADGWARILQPSLDALAS